MGDIGGETFLDSEMPQELNDLLSFVRTNSPYYQRLWRNVPSDGSASLDQYPVVDHASYWTANTCMNSQVLTGPHVSGIVLKTGGTTSHPKVTFYTKDELRMASQQLGLGILAAGVRSHDRVANLFYAGEMYGSFLLHVLSIMDLTIPLVHLPIGGSCASETTIQYMRESSATVVFSTVTTLVKLAEYLLERQEVMPGIRVLMFSGEAFYEDQRSRVSHAFPGAMIRSLIYGSIDAGALGYSTSENDSRLHAVSSPYVMLEIAPDGLTSTKANGIPGSVLVTNMGRRLQPVIRYPSGDLAEWVDYEKGIFRVLGRDIIGVRIGPVSFDTKHLRQIVASSLDTSGDLSAFQAVISRANMRDVLTLNVGFRPVDEEATKIAISAALNDARPMFLDHVQRGLIAPLQIEFLAVERFKISPTTGKLAELVDERPTMI
ncbi:hypothetical protein ONS95_009319 [Cadophora gregata]|uniref:uncharacterized protein n=1 Tax=Cadophora gregata TaxID=51156 RepID=UPI0026DA9B5D|nr:uncharacterized protein ONS95_009319 [Cadophora gregata]KAK0124351.1 hypothetical protein ONS95_009319 [Cadophora gregata]